MGTLGGLLLLELVLRLVWGAVVLPDERPLLDGSPLGPALRDECWASAVSWLGDRTDDALYEPDPLRGIRLRPDVSVPHLVQDGSGRSVQVVTDALGMRRPAGPPPSPPAPDALRVLVVGDSFTFGEGVEGEQAYPARLQPLLAQALGRPVRVYNAGVVWIGQDEELGALRELVPQLHPDLVLLQFTPANDVIDDLHWRPGITPLEPDPDRLRELAEHPLLTNPLARWSRLYRLLAWRWGRHALRYRLMLEPRHLDRAAGLIVRCRDAAGGAPFGVLIAPSVVQVQRSLSERVLGTVGINRGIASRLEAEGIPVLDPLDALAAADRDGEQLYLPRDRHWSPQGNQRVAEALVPFLQRLLAGEGAR